MRERMKAVAVTPGEAASVRLVEMEKPSHEQIPEGRGVLVKVLRVGVDGTDSEIIAAEYGAAPEDSDFLVIGHESFGRVEAVGAGVRDLRPGDYVVATVRRPGTSIYDRLGRPDLTTDDVYRERGINLLHGYLAEYYAEDAGYIIKVPEKLNEVAVLAEPMSIVQKALAQAYHLQQRLPVWFPERAAVMGAGTIGLLITLGLRLRGLEVDTFAKGLPPNISSELCQALGARYRSVEQLGLREAAKKVRGYDIICDATGYSPVAFEAMEAIAKNGVLVLTSVTGGDRKTEVPSDHINLGFVLGNKVMVGIVNASREHFRFGLRDMALAEAQFPGWLSRLLTHRFQGLESYREMFEALEKERNAVKVYCQVAT